MNVQEKQFQTPGISYFDRIKKGLAFTIVVCLIILFFGTTTNNLFLTMILPLIIFIIYGYEVLQWNKIYITSITIQGDNILLKYLNYDKIVNLSIPISTASLKIKHVWYKVRAPHCYINISDNKGNNIKQHIGGYWDKSKFIALIEVVEENRKI